MQSRINGYSLLVLANEDVGRDILFIRSYEAGETQYLANFISRSSVCFDVGANIGYFTLLMAKHAPLGKVYAFEPIPLNAFLLRASIELNKYENIEVNCIGVGADSVDVTFTQSTDSAYSSIQDTERKPVERTFQVPMTTLDSFVGKRNITSIDLLKVDVEGAEGLVIQGSKRLLDDPNRRPRLVLMELFDDNLVKFNTGSSSIVETMIEFGYQAFCLNPDSELVPFDEQALGQVYNVFFLDSNKHRVG
jgi:FkbM family methyltransferase